MNEEPGASGSSAECPICTKPFSADSIEMHVNRCIFLNSTEFGKPKESNNKRSFSIFAGSKKNGSPDNVNKKLRNTNNTTSAMNPQKALSSPTTESPTPLKPIQDPDMPKMKKENVTEKSMPLAEKMRPNSIEDYIGQMHVMGKNAILRKILDKNETPSMILVSYGILQTFTCITNSIH